MGRLYEEGRNKFYCHDKTLVVINNLLDIGNKIGEGKSQLVL